MNYSAYLATGQMIALMQSFSKIKVRTHGQESIPVGSIIFVVNHFTRIETLLLPYYIYTHTHVPVWSLADHSFFEGTLSGYLAKIGAVSTKNPDRDRLIVKTLLTGENNYHFSRRSNGQGQGTLHQTLNLRPEPRQAAACPYRRCKSGDADRILSQAAELPADGKRRRSGTSDEHVSD